VLCDAVVPRIPSVSPRRCRQPPAGQIVDLNRQKNKHQTLSAHKWLQEKDIEDININIGGLSLLWDKFSFFSLSEGLSVFRESGFLREVIKSRQSEIAVLTSPMKRGEWKWTWTWKWK
jgi:hypothetical protein